eukprot:2364195-Prymnesium_polylepis.3
MMKTAARGRNVFGRGRLEAAPGATEQTTPCGCRRHIERPRTWQRHEGTARKSHKGAALKGSVSQGVHRACQLANA